PLVKCFYCAMVVLLAGLLTGKRCGFSSQRSSGGGGPAPFRRDDAEKVGKIRKFPGPMIKRWRDQGAGMDCGDNGAVRVYRHFSDDRAGKRLPSHPFGGDPDLRRI